MSELSAHPSLEQYKKQAKEFLRAVHAGNVDAVDRVRRWHPRYRKAKDDAIGAIVLADAQRVLAREHGFPSWAQFAAHVDTVNLVRALDDASGTVGDPGALFLEFASVERHGWHGSGTVDQANLILSRYPEVATASIYAAAVLGDAGGVAAFLASDAALATKPGGPHGWDALTYLCFSRYLRLDRARSEGFVAAARALLEAGASANTGWWETLDEDPPRQVPETAIYGAAGLAQSAGVTRVLLEFGADPNDEETPYHVVETRDNTVLKILLESGRFHEQSLATVLMRKADWHDEEGMALALEHGANPNYLTHWKHTPFQHAIRRDNGLEMISLLLDHGADPSIRNHANRRNAFQMAVYHGRGDILRLLEQRGFAADYDGPTAALDALVAACARGDGSEAHAMIAGAPELGQPLFHMGGTLLARFAGVGNLEGVRTLLELGVAADAPWPEGDPYWETPRNSTALQYAAWRAWHDVVRELIARGANVNATDARGRTPLQLAVRACTDSYWKSRRKPDSVAALLAAGATKEGVKLPTGYEEIDQLLMAP